MLKFRYIFRKRWAVQDFRFTFLPSISYSGKSSSKERTRTISIRWMCFTWVFQWYKERTMNYNSMLLGYFNGIKKGL